MDNEKIARAVQDMIVFYCRESSEDKRLHDINHFSKVWGFAHTIGIAEGLDDKTQETLELAAIAHDIACPLCRRTYGNAPGKAQESEGGPLTEEFYRSYQLPADELNRIVYLVSHHHTYTSVVGADYQILLEADFLVNADEEQESDDAIETFKEKVFRTPTGIHMLEEMYQHK